MAVHDTKREFLLDHSVAGETAMHMLRDIRFSTTIFFVADVCLFATMCYTFSFFSNIVLASPCSLYNKSVYLSLPPPGGMPAIQVRDKPDDTALPDVGQSKTLQHTYASSEYCFDMALSGDSSKGQRNDKTTAQSPHKTVSGITPDLSFIHISFPVDEIFIGMTRAVNGLSGLRAGHIRAGP